VTTSARNARGLLMQLRIMQLIRKQIHIFACPAYSMCHEPKLDLLLGPWYEIHSFKGLGCLVIATYLPIDDVAYVTADPLPVRLCILCVTFGLPNSLVGPGFMRDDNWLPFQ
jgi:hypothetical protein